MNIDTYGEAFNSHRHYDVMATTLFGFFVAIIVASAPAYFYIKENVSGLMIPYLLILSLILYYCIDTYRRFDRYAAIALNVARAIELDNKKFTNSSIGFAVVFKEIKFYPEMEQQGESTTFNRVKIIAAIFYFIALLLLINEINRLSV